MFRRYRFLPVPLCLLAACQTVPSQRAGPAAGTAGLGTIPGCATDASATLADGIQVGYLGSDPNDPQRCLLRWADRAHVLYFGFWSSAPEAPLSEQARAAISTALTGPVGTEASFETDRARLWSSITVAHIGNPLVEVGGQQRPALELRVVRHDALGRPDVRAETRYTIDRATGVLLRSESVTPMADGEVSTITSWQLGRLSASG
jgi:hypothetical protein